MSGEATGGKGASHEPEGVRWWLLCGQGEVLVAASLVVVAAIAWSPTASEWIDRFQGEITGSPSAEFLVTTCLYLLGLAGMVLMFSLTYRQPALEAEAQPVFREEPPPPVIEKIGVVATQKSVLPSARATNDLTRSDLLVIENISPLTLRKLNNAGIHSLKDLMMRGSTLSGRQDIARQTGINVRRLTDWLNKVDLMEAAGLDIEKIRLLEVAGISSVNELLSEDPGMVFRKIAAYNSRSHVTDQLPSLDDLQNWVEKARQHGSLLR